MIDRVNLNRLINQALETENRVRRKEVRPTNEETQQPQDMVNISQAARTALRMNSEDFSQKVERIKQDIAAGRYEVNPEKIVEGFKKFMF